MKIRPALAAMAVAAAACRGAERPAARASEPPPLPADVANLATPAPVSEAAARPGEQLVATGEFVAPVSSELAVRSPGRVGRVFVDAGASVRRGQPLLELETEYLKLDVQRAEADLARAAAAAAEAERDFARKQDLIAKGSVAQAVYDRSRGGFEQASAAKASAEATLALARQHLADAVLESPIDGIVVERRTDVGERLGDSSVAFVIAQTAPLRLRFKLPERYLASLREGQPVVAHVDPEPDRVFEGRLSVIVRAVDPQTRSFVAEAEFENRDRRLKPGLFARVELALPPGQEPAE